MNFLAGFIWRRACSDFAIERKASKFSFRQGIFLSHNGFYGDKK
jgi:hypothetical protein